jgi:hypothetical protein
MRLIIFAFGTTMFLMTGCPPSPPDSVPKPASTKSEPGYDEQLDHLDYLARRDELTSRVIELEAQLPRPVPAADASPGRLPPTGLEQRCERVIGALRQDAIRSLRVQGREQSAAVAASRLGEALAAFRQLANESDEEERP